MSNYILEPQTILFRLLIALFLGFVIGIDRDDGWRQKETSARASRFTFLRPGKFAIGLGGVRTYTMLSIFGFILGTMYALDQRTLGLVIAGIVGVIAYICIAYFLNYFDRHTLGLTSELGMLILLSLTFALGSGILDTRIVVGISIIVSLISSLKVEFQKIIGTFTKKEIVESIEFLAISAVVLPWLPNKAYTFAQLGNFLNIDFGAISATTFINPFQLWLVVVFISALNFVGYFLAKLLQSSSSVLLTAFLGGIVSSTSVTQLMAERSKAVKSSATMKLLAAATLIANSTSFIRIPLIALAINPALFLEVFGALFLLTVITLAIAFFWQRNTRFNEHNPTVFSSPLALKPALAFALLFFFVSLATSIAQTLIGSSGFVATVLLASASGLDAITIVIGQAVTSTIPLSFGAAVLFGAVITNLLFKIGVVAIYGDRKFTYLTAGALAAISLIGATLLAFFLL